MAAPLIPIIISGIVYKAAPKIAEFLIKRGFRKASSSAIKKQKNKEPIMLNMHTAKKIVANKAKQQFQNRTPRTTPKPKTKTLDASGKKIKVGKKGRKDAGKIKKEGKTGSKRPTPQEKMDVLDQILLRERQGTSADVILKNQIKKIKEARFPPRQPHQKQGDLIFPNLKTKAGELTENPEILKFLKSGPKKMKKGGRIGKPKGVGVAQRGFGKAMKRGK